MPPRPKSQLRQQLSYRRLRWAASHAVFAALPEAGRRLNFYRRGVYPSDVAEAIVEDESVVVRAGFSAAERAMVRDQCRFADAGSAFTDCTGIGTFVARTQIVRDVEILGHTGAIAVPRADALIWAVPGPPSWNLAKPRRLRPVSGPKGRVVALSGTVNYFHFLMNDVIPLVDYLDRLHPAGEPLTVVVPGTPPPFTGQTMAALEGAYPGLRTLSLGRSEKMPVEVLVVIERRSANREWFLWDAAPARRLKDILMTGLALTPAATAAKRLYVSRGQTRVRQLLNEEDLVRIAEARGFESFTPAADNFAEQIARFDAARTVVAVHGAALTNLVWCRPSAQVFELSPANFVKSCYLWLADRMELRHHAVIGERGDAVLGFRVDPDAFARRLDGLLESGARAAE